MMTSQAASTFARLEPFSHVSFDSGHTSLAASNTVTEEVIRHFEPIVAKALCTGLPVAVPLISPYAFLRISDHESCFLAELLARDGQQYLPIVSFGISPTPGAGIGLWTQMRTLAQARSGQTKTPELPPNSPWIGAVIEDRAPLYLQMLVAAGELERTVAWTLTRVLWRDTGTPVNTAPAGEQSAKAPFRPVNDGTSFDCSQECGPTLTIHMSNPRAQEIVDIRRGESRFALAMHGPIVFLLARFGGIDWMDAPFHAGLYPSHLRGMPRDWKPGTRLGLAVQIVDSQTGQQHGARLLSLSPHFWDTFAANVHRQASQPILRAEYDEAIGRAYSAYPTARAMLKKALVSSKAGD